LFNTRHAPDGFIWSTASARIMIAIVWLPVLPPMLATASGRRARRDR